MHGGQSRIAELGELDVVETGDGHVPWHADSALVHLAQCSHGRDVVDADDGGGRETRGQQGARGLPAALERVGVGGGPHFDLGNPGHGIEHGFHVLIDRSQQGVVPHETQAPVAQAVQVIDHLPDASAVVDANVGDVRPGRADIVEDHRNAAVGDLVDERRLHLRHDGGQARDAPPDHQPDAGDQLLGPVVGVGYHHFEAAGMGAGFDSLIDVRKRFSRLETITPMVRLLPPARLRACRLGWYFSSSMAWTTRARVLLLTMLALLSTRDTVAVETLARRATCSRLISSTYCRAHRYDAMGRRRRCACRGRAAAPIRPGSGAGSDVFGGVLVLEVALLVEAFRDVGDHHFGPNQRVHVEEHEHLAEVILGADGAECAERGAHHRYRLGVPRVSP